MIWVVAVRAPSRRLESQPKQRSRRDGARTATTGTARLHFKLNALDAAVGYYETQWLGLGLDLEAQIRQTLQSIQQQPQLYPPYKRTTLRRCLVERFPYAVYYREYGEHISVVAIAHGKRRPGYWRNRTSLRNYEAGN